MVNYPEINPVALSIGPITVYWYGLMYLLAFVTAWGLGVYRAKKRPSILTPEEVGDLFLFWAVLGVILGGRIGYVLFYQFQAFIHDPLYLFKIWGGGMSFHGGLLGAMIVVYIFAKKHHKSFLGILDFAVPLVPPGLMFGRIGNFINAELWGRTTDLPWGIVFPQGGPLARHPTQLYEALGEGLILFIVLWVYSAKPRPVPSVTGLFLVGYGIIRFLIEFVREPDAHLGFILFDSLTMGQLLSIPMVLLGLYLMARSRHASIS